MGEALTAFIFLVVGVVGAAAVFEVFLIVKAMDVRWGDAVRDVVKSWLRIDQ